MGSSPGRRRRPELYDLDKWRMADWDGDGKVDLLFMHDFPQVLGPHPGETWRQLTWRQQLSNHSFQTHELMRFRWTKIFHYSLEVADWNADQKMDLLLCRKSYTRTTDVLFLDHSLLPLHGLDMELEEEHVWDKLIRHMNVSLLLSVTHAKCDMWAVDFDGDGDLDLFLGQRYFERTATGDLIARNESPIATDMFNGNVLQIADLDGDGQLEVITEGESSGGQSATYTQLRYFRQSVDGRLVESLESPLAGIALQKKSVRSEFPGGWSSIEAFEVLQLTDWDSDGLMDLVKMQFESRYAFKVVAFYQHVVKLDMAYNSQVIAYEKIKMDLAQFRVIDWDGDGWDDVVAPLDGRLHLYEVKAHNIRDLIQPFEHLTLTNSADDFMFSLVDWDSDGGWDLIVATTSDFKVHFFEMDMGSLKPEEPEHPFSDIRLDRHFSPQVLPVDWDNDGDFDLVLGSGRYFEQLADGTFYEWSLQQSPFIFLCSNMSWNRRCNFDLRFLDCDGDGDSDFILRTGQQFQACEHDSIAGTVRCDDNFLCLGADVGHSSSFPGQFQNFGEWDVGKTSDGRLKLFAQHTSRPGLIQWTAGFCEPSTDPCHGKGVCRPGQLHCHCFAGHELEDCSQCESKYYTLRADAGQFRDCQPCPGQGGHVCHGRGECFDDASARNLSRHYAAALEATGNGSCRCHEVYFNGSDMDGRSTCSDGSCPAGTEERDGQCHPCNSGYYSLPGGFCRKCGPGKYSETANSSCLKCPEGSVSMVEGASVCSPCPPGKFEVQNRWCSDCQPGFASLGGNSSCAPCQAGYVAFNRGSITCDPCEAGTFSIEESSKCIPCRRGTTSGPASEACLSCPPGSVSSTEGASACEKCPGGKYAASSQACNDCQPGFASLGGNSSCTKCEAGYVAMNRGSITCEPCAAGTFSQADGSKCSDCLPGFASLGGNSSCTKCEAGYVAMKHGSITCEPCAAGTFSQADGSKCIPCRPGTTSGPASEACLSCPPGSVSKAEGASACEKCPEGSHEVKHLWCDQCPSGKVVMGTNFSCADCPAGQFASQPGSRKCELCPAGTFSETGSDRCSSCPSGSISGSPGSAKCESCEWMMIRATPNVAQQICQVDFMNVLLAVLFVVSSTCVCFLCLLGCHGQMPMSDLSSQGQKLVITTAIPHLLLKGSCPKVTFTGTGVPKLEGPNADAWRVKPLNSIQLSLLSDNTEITESTMQVDTSMGYFKMKFPSAFLHFGLLRCPLVIWCLVFSAASAVTMSQLTRPLTLVASFVATLAGSSAFAWRCRQGQRTPLAKRRRQFLKEWQLLVGPCDRGPDRSMTAGKLQDFVQFFEAFIKERSMYYVCSNIVKPLTKPYQLSFVEVVGSTGMQWFVSHYWGMAVRHFNDAIRKHAQSYASDWRELAYWICTFSNSQWHVKDELGNGQWQESSFYLALRSPSCKGTAMVIDEQVLPLSRIWCLFEVYHTIRLSESDHFQGLLLCTSTGVLQQGRAGTDVAVRVAERAAELDTRSAEASDEEDRQMILALIAQMRGGFNAMDNYVRERICEALEASHQHYEATFKGLICELTSRVAAARAESAESAESPALPTLLTCGTSMASNQTTKNTILPVGQEYPDVSI